MKFETLICDQEMYANGYGEFMVEEFTGSATLVEAHVGDPVIDVDWHEEHDCVDKTLFLDAFNVSRWMVEHPAMGGAYKCPACMRVIFPQWKLPESEIAVIWEFYFTTVSDEPMPEYLTLTMEVGGWQGQIQTEDVTFRRIGFYRASLCAYQNVYASVEKVSE